MHDKQIELLQKRCQALEDKFRDTKKSTKSNKAMHMQTTTNNTPVFNHSSTHSHNNKQWWIHHRYPLHSAPTTTFHHHVPSCTDTSS